ncbi:hypothetical protein ACX0KY_20690 [Pseudomonas extremorientalis]|uniref:hypothetical protein n=1 Tax=Pseudomonas extremorientalis TaxID=169669 RepID=UPI00211CD2BF|nr:hypothetical protein [Pseudomonas extremorientalis]UUN87336.1 hypothetical protein LUU92_21125 [Pseudomonas extremorientalis]
MPINSNNHAYSGNTHSYAEATEPPTYYEAAKPPPAYTEKPASTSNSQATWQPTINLTALRLGYQPEENSLAMIGTPR